MQFAELTPVSRLDLHSWFIRLRWTACVVRRKGDHLRRGRGKWQISRDGGAMPRWRGDGKEIIFMDPGKVLHAASVETDGTSVRVDEVTELFPSRMNSAHATRTHDWAMTSDAQQFVVPVPSSESAPVSTVRLVLNWMKE